MKTAVSIPDDLFAAAEAEAKRLGISRSKLHQIALVSYLRSRREAKLKAAIDAYVRDHGTKLTEEDEAWLTEGRKTVRKLTR